MGNKNGNGFMSWHECHAQITKQTWGRLKHSNNLERAPSTSAGRTDAIRRRKEINACSTLGICGNHSQSAFRALLRAGEKIRGYGRERAVVVSPVGAFDDVDFAAVGPAWACSVIVP